MMKRIVSVVQVVALVTAALFVVLLFANEPDGVPSTTPRGAAVFASNCAVCHGSDGGGGAAPSLRRIVHVYPNVADQIAVVTNGRSAMPAWSGRLTVEEIAAVVDYTRTGL